MYVEFKIKSGDTWEGSPVLEEVFFMDKALDKYAPRHAQRLANKHRQQVRWNRKGLLQGHYVDPSQKILLATSEVA